MLYVEIFGIYLILLNYVFETSYSVLSGSSMSYIVILLRFLYSIVCSYRW